MEDVLIKVENVSKKFSKDLKTSLKYGFFDAGREIFGLKHKAELRPTEFWAVKNISFEVKRGESIGLIGHNGAGKSTLLKMLNGLIRPDEGSIEMKGKIGALIELGAGFNPILTGRENIYINAAVLGFNKKEIQEKFESIIAFSEIGDFIDTPVQNYSSGMKVRLGFAIAAQMEPDVLIIDEVLAVGDTGFKIKCFNRIAELKEKCAVIFVSHSMPQVSRICNKAIYMSKGQMQYNGDNMTQAVETYYNSFDTDTIGLNFNKEKIEIGNVSVENQNGSSNINHNDDFILNFTLNNKNSSQIDAFSIIITDNDYRAVASSVADLSSNRIEKENRIKMIIPKIQLGVGTYFISLHFFESMNTDIRGKVVEQFQNIISFKVYNSPMVSTASFQLLNKIELKNN
jgi:lipopolysaccharide transport system ATP-binding protein